MNLFSQLTEKDKKDILHDIINEDTAATRAKYSSLADAYYTNDLKKIEALVSEEMKNYKDMESKFLIKRNYNMADKIAELAKKQSLFAAIGAAHLPGKEGVINLLKKKGYSLRPVKMVKSGSSAKYLDEMTKKLWEVFTPADGGYSIEMPGKPSSIPVPAEIPGTEAEAVFYNDAGTGSVFIAIRYIHPEPLSDTKIDSIVNNLTTAMSASGLKTSGGFKDIKFAGIKGREINGEMMNYISVAKVLFDKRTMYWLQALRPSSMADTTNVNRFFNSFKPKK